MALHSNMNLGQAQNEFRARYYRWALTQAATETGGGYPLLRRLGPGLCSRFLAFIDSLALEDRIKMAVVLVKRFHREALLVTGDSISISEEKLAEAYSNAILIPSREEQALLQRELTGHPLPQINRRKLLSSIRKHLDPVLGATYESWGLGAGRYSSEVSNWVIYTYIDTGGRHHQVTYDHAITTSKDSRLHECISLLSWLGMSSQTMWRYLSDADIEPTAKCLADLCSHFLNATKELLEGICVCENGSRP